MRMLIACPGSRCGWGQRRWCERLAAKPDILRLTTRGLERGRRSGSNWKRISSAAIRRAASSAVGGKARAGPGGAAHDAQAARKRQSVGVLVGVERHLVHERADRVVDEQVAVGLLVD